MLTQRCDGGLWAVDCALWAVRGIGTDLINPGGARVPGGERARRRGWGIFGLAVDDPNHLGGAAIRNKDVPRARLHDHTTRIVEATEYGFRFVIGPSRGQTQRE